MSTDTNQMASLPEDIAVLKSMVLNAMAKLMAHSHTVQELLKANMELKAGLQVAQSAGGQLEAVANAVLNPQIAAAVETDATAVTTAVETATQATATDSTATDANSVSA